jgi:hypothetical protein
MDFIGPRGHYRCEIHNADAMPNGWRVKEIMDNGTHILSMHMTREDAFMHARGMAGLDPDVAIEPDVAVEPEEPLPDRRGLVEHSRKMA